MSDDRLLDARGMRCPWPVLRLARAMRDLPEGARLHILADDPIAPREIAALAEEHDWGIDPGPGEALADYFITR